MSPKMKPGSEACPLCDVGVASPVSTLHVIEHEIGKGVADLHLMHCGACESEYAGTVEMAFNKAAAEKLRSDMQTFAVTGSPPAGMIKCWSCRVLMYLEQRSENDGYCPACDCEIEL